MICNLIKPIRPKIKRDPVSIVFGSAISAIGGMASSSIAASEASSQNAQQRAWSSEEWTRQFEMQQAAQRYNQANQLSDYREEWNRQFDIQNEYNSPAAQAQRLRAAGFNPAMMMANGASSTSVPVSANVPQPASVPQPGTPVAGSFNPQYSAFADSIKAVGGLFKDLAEAKKNGAQTSEIEQTLSHKVNLLVAQINGQELDNCIKELDKQFFSKSMPVRVKKAYQDLRNAEISEQVSALTMKEIDANVRLKASETLLNDILQEKGIKEKDLLIKQLGVFDQLTTENIKNLRSQTAKNYEEANNAKQEAALSELNQKILAPDATKASITDAWLKADNTHRKMFVEQLEAKIDASTGMSTAEKLEAEKKIRILRKEENFPLGLSDALDWLRSKVPALVLFTGK